MKKNRKRKKIVKIRSFENPQRVSVILDYDFLKHLRKKASEISVKMEFPITLCETIRLALEKVYPMERK